MSESRVKIALWGIGGMYRQCANLLQGMQAAGGIELVAVADSRRFPFTRLDGMPVVAPDRLRGIEFDFLVLMNEKAASEMRAQAVGELGISAEKVLTYRILQVPGFDFPTYRRLRSAPPSIFSDTEWAARACETLQIECRSPFGQTSFKKADYLRLLADPRAYLERSEPVFREKRFNYDGGEYLLFDLADIEVRMMGATDPDEALASWSAGVARIDWDNVFVEMTTIDRRQEEEFNALEGFARKVCFVPYPTDLPHSIQLPLLPGMGLFDLCAVQSVSQNRNAVALDLLALLSGSGEARRFEMAGDDAR